MAIEIKPESMLLASHDMLPGMMLLYSFHLERFSTFSRKLLKRLTYTHFQTLRLLLYVEERTGRIIHGYNDARSKKHVAAPERMSECAFIGAKRHHRARNCSLDVWLHHDKRCAGPLEDPLKAPNEWRRSHGPGRFKLNELNLIHGSRAHPRHWG